MEGIIKIKFEKVNGQRIDNYRNDEKVKKAITQLIDKICEELQKDFKRKGIESKIKAEVYI